MNKNISVLIPDGESHLLFYILSCLTEVKDIEIHVMSNNQRDAMRYSHHLKSFIYYPKVSREEDWISKINTVVAQNEIDVILPIFEKGIRTLIAHKNKIASPQKLVNLPPLNSFDNAVDKWELKKHLAKYKLPYPKSQIIDHNTDIQNLKLSFPLIGKPTKGFGGGMEVFLFNDIDGLSSYLKNPNIPKTYLLQEYLEGDDYCCNVLCKNGEILAFTIQKGILWGNKKLGPQLGYEFQMNNEVYTLVQQLMRSLKWSGIACVDLRLDCKTGTYFIIEINARFWSSLLGSLFAGVNFPHLLVLETLGQPIPEQTFKFNRSVNLKGILPLFKKEPRIFLNIHFLWYNTPLKYAIKDPLPMIIKYVTRTKIILLRSMGNFFHLF